MGHCQTIDWFPKRNDNNKKSPTIQYLPGGYQVRKIL